MSGLYTVACVSHVILARENRHLVTFYKYKKQTLRTVNVIEGHICLDSRELVIVRNLKPACELPPRTGTGCIALALGVGPRLALRNPKIWAFNPSCLKIRGYPSAQALALTGRVQAFDLDTHLGAHFIAPDRCRH